MEAVKELFASLETLSDEPEYREYSGYMLDKSEYKESALRLFAELDVIMDNLYDKAMDMVADDREPYEHEKYTIRKQAKYVIALLDGEVAGLLQYRLFPKYKTIYIGRVIVAETHRRQGIANGLFDVFNRTIKTMKDYERITLSTVSTDKPAIKLYEKLGYKTTNITMEKSHR